MRAVSGIFSDKFRKRKLLVDRSIWLSLVPGIAALAVLLVYVKERVGKASHEFKLLVGMREVLRKEFAVFAFDRRGLLIGRLQLLVCSAKRKRGWG